jgi:hypothetical protein
MKKVGKVPKTQKWENPLQHGEREDTSTLVRQDREKEFPQRWKNLYRRFTRFEKSISWNEASNGVEGKSSDAPPNNSAVKRRMERDSSVS